MKRSSIQQLKLRTGCARCRKLGHWARECPHERYDRRAMRSGGKLKRVHHCRKSPRNEDLSSSVFPGRSSLSTLEKSCGILVPKREGLVGKQQLDKWCEFSRGTRSSSRMEPGESQNPQAASGGMTQPIGVVYVPVGLAGCNGIIRFTVVEQDVPPLLPLGIMRTLQASLDLTDDRDKVIFRQFGGESSLRTLQSGHTVTHADQFDSDGWQLPEITELCQDNDEGCATNYMSVIAHVYQRPICMDNDTPAGDHDPASTRSCRPRQKTTSNDHGPARSHPTNPRTSSLRFKSGKQMHDAFSKTMSGIHGRARDATSPGQAQRHGTLWTIGQWKRLAHCIVYTLCLGNF